MSNILNTIKNFITANKQKMILLISLIGVMIVIIIAIAIMVKVVGSKITYEELEKKLTSAAESYTKDFPAELPTTEVPTKVISATTLIEKEYIKELKKYVKDASCTANVNVTYKDGTYNYQTFLTCKNFKTEKLIDTIKNSNQLSSFGEGLYEINNELVYRGDNPNNYIKFADRLWRIVKVNNKGQFILILNDLDSKNYGKWDDRYNTEKSSQKGINNYSLSRALENLMNIYQENYSQYSAYLSKFDLCIGKRNENNITKDGSVECNNVMADQTIGLLPVYDYMNASLDSLCIMSTSNECQNYNYLVNNKDKWWTVTGNSDNTYEVFYINYSGKILYEEAIMSANYRYTIALKDNVLYKSGAGTLEDPYEIR